MTSKYAYLVWFVAMLTSWLSFVLSFWLFVLVDAFYFGPATFWLAVTLLGASVTNVKARR